MTTQLFLKKLWQLRRSLFKIIPLFLFLTAVTYIIIDSSQKEEIVGRENVRAKVIETDDSALISSTIARIGHQKIKLKILSGTRKGESIEGESHLNGKPEWDCFCEPGDTVILGLFYQDDKIIKSLVIEHDRRFALFLLIATFSLIVIIFALTTGLRALFSFAASGVILWYFLLPGLAKGVNPLLISFFTIIILSAIILFSIAGWSEKAVASFLGTICGLFLTYILTILFGSLLKLNGMTQPFSELVLMSNPLISFRSIFYSGILIGASGAAMDVAIDISSSIEEIHLKRPDLPFKDLFKSGIKIGRAVIGTMTTTLLLAYSGGYISLLLLFQMRSSSITDVINMKIVASEIMRTVVGSTGLVLVAPLTALFAASLYTSNSKIKDIWKSHHH